MYAAKRETVAPPILRTLIRLALPGPELETTSRDNLPYLLFCSVYNKNNISRTSIANLPQWNELPDDASVSICTATGGRDWPLRLEPWLVISGKRFRLFCRKRSEISDAPGELWPATL